MESKNTRYLLLNSDIDTDKDLTPSLKVLFARINGLAKERGYCYATNKYFASCDNCTVRAVQYKLSALVSKKYIRIEEHKNAISGQIDRLIFVTKTYIQDALDKDAIGGEKNLHTHVKEFHPGGERISPNNNIYNNNTKSILLDKSNKTDIKRKRFSSSVSKSKPDIKANKEVKEVFDYWKTKLERTRSQLTAPRIKKINARLKQGYLVAELKQAIDGVLKSDWHMGRETGTPYVDFQTIFRDDGQVEKFIAMSKAKPKKEVTERVVTEQFSTCRLCETADMVGKPCPVHGGKKW